MSLQGLGQISIPWRNHNSTFQPKEHPISEQGETIIGIYLLILGWLSWFGNSIVIFVLYRQRMSLQPQDYLTFNLAMSDASISVFGYSRGIIQIFNVFRDDDFLVTSIWTCQIDGFLTLLFGLVSINTHTVISVIRYIKACHPHRVYSISAGNVAASLALIWIAGIFWSGAPLFNWGSYADRMYGTCEIDWDRANYSTIYKSYIISIFICCFFLPVSVMLFSYVSIINTVKSSHAFVGNTDLSDRQRRMERDVTRVSMVICTAFMIAWSPYAVISMWSASGYHVPQLTSIFASLFAKSASFYNPMIYFGLNSKFRKDIYILLPCAKKPKESVKLKRFKLLTHRPEQQQSAYKDRYTEEPQQMPSPDSGMGSPSKSPPCQNKDVFFVPMGSVTDDSLYECHRL